MSGNQLTHLQGLYGCPEIGTLDVSNNFLPTQEDLFEGIAPLENLCSLDFRGNPLETAELAESVHRLYQFDFINGRQMQEVGTYFKIKAERLTTEMVEEEMYGFSECDALLLQDPPEDELPLAQKSYRVMSE